VLSSRRRAGDRLEAYLLCKGLLWSRVGRRAPCVHTARVLEAIRAVQVEYYIDFARVLAAFCADRDLAPADRVRAVIRA
jgi:hypothetical protein